MNKITATAGELAAPLPQDPDKYILHEGARHPVHEYLQLVSLTWPTFYGAGAVRNPAHVLISLAQYGISVSDSRVNRRAGHEGCLYWIYEADWPDIWRGGPADPALFAGKEVSPGVYQPELLLGGLVFLSNTSLEDRSEVSASIASCT